MRRKVFAISVLALLLVGCTRRPDPFLVDDTKGHHSHPVWSPDGNSLAFILDSDLWLMSSLSGHHKQRITGEFFTTKSRDAQLATWLPDGRIAYVEWASDLDIGLPDRSVRLYDPKNRRTTVVKQGLNRIDALARSPLGNEEVWLIMDSSPDVRSPGSNSAYRLDIKTGTLTSLPFLPTDRGLSDLKWIPGSDRVAYVLKQRLYVVDLKTGDTIDLPDGTDDVGAIAVSPNGRWIAFRRYATSRNGRRGGTFVVDANLHNPPHQLSSVEMVSLDWSPDGTKLVYTTVGAPGQNELRLFEVPAEFQ